ncbi:hypothetical protein Acr_08g0018140 [Actinidia rufa]|uniref:Uncharacterized protein n=1 Tax=Actinidia rufa TaxID=165716 RepID=A0A7J0F405_9ERIC|nr:hypothetical protein Acr_08g0018140 [Actinidia rufa]
MADSHRLSPHEMARHFLNSMSFCYCIAGFLAAIRELMSITWPVFGGMLYTTAMVSTVYSFFAYELHRLYRHMPYQSIGCFRKTMVDVISVCAPLVLRLVVPFDVWFLISLVWFTTYLHNLGQILHVAADINYWDMLLGIVMQILVYLTSHSLPVCSAVLVFCGIVIFYRYLSYEAPITYDDVKKDLGDRPNMVDDDVKRDLGDRPNIADDDIKRDEDVELEIQALQIEVAINAAAIEMRRDEVMELENQGPQIGVAISAAAIEMRRDEDMELENQGPQIGVAISATAIEMRRDEDMELENQAPQIFKSFVISGLIFVLYFFYSFS